MTIGALDTDRRVVVVAEIGNNHEGDLGVARELVRAAAGSGADAVKLQMFAARRFVRPSETARLRQLARFELPPAAFAELHDLARELGLGFLCTPLDLESAEFLAPLVDAFKIASADNDWPELLEAVAGAGKPLLVSTGMSDLEGIGRAQQIVEARWRALGIDGELALLHCVSTYPVSPARASLATIPALREAFGVTVGYSDHTLGLDACLAAVALGARIIEKHFTLSHQHSEFRDHQLSAKPAELRELVERVALVTALVGEPRTGLLAEEEAIAAAARRSIAAAADLSAGRILEAADLTCMRPGDGLAPGRAGELVGRRLRRARAFGEPLSLEDVD